MKADLFDRRARISADVFNYDVKDQQLSAVGGQDNSTQLINAKKVTGQGFELNLDAYLLPTLLVTLNGSYNFTKIKDPGLTVAPCGNFSAATPTTPAVPICTVTNPLDAAGNAED